MAVQAQKIWQELQVLIEKNKHTEAIELLEEQLPQCEELDEMGNMAHQLAHLYRQKRDANDNDKAVHYAVLAGQVYVRMGRIAPAMAIISWLRDDPHAHPYMLELKQSVVDSFSRVSKVKRKDDDIPPPTPYEEISGVVHFDSDDVKQAREQWKGYVGQKQHDVSLFSKLRSDELNELIEIAVLRDLAPGTTLFREGEPAHAFYIVAEGEIDLSSSIGFHKVFHEGDFFGELALFGRMNRTATLKTKNGVKLLEFSKEGLNECMMKFRNLRRQVMAFYEIRLFLNVAARTTFFKGLSEEELEGIFTYFHSHTAKAGEVLFEQGSESDCLFFIVNGYCEVFRNNKFLAKLGPGQFIGEVGVVHNIPRLAQVKAFTDCHLMECHALVYNKLCERFPKIEKMLLELAKVRKESLEDEKLEFPEGLVID